MTTDRDSYLKSVLIGGREAVEIVVVDYDPTWPDKFEGLAADIRLALVPSVISVDHIGSTSVPGLAAKPIIDVQLVVTDLNDEGAYLPALGNLGYELRVREPNHRMVRTPARDVHVHIYGPHSPEAAATLLLRDHLRVNQADLDLYAATKRELARRSWRDMNEYADAKSAVITSILQRAVAHGPGADGAGR